MKRALTLVVGFALCTVPLTAQPSTQGPGSSGLAGVIEAADDPRLKEALESRTLFFVLPAGQGSSEGRSLEFRVQLNGQPYLVETLALGPLSDESPAFELLATKPILRDRLYQLGGKASNRITVQVVLDGQLLREFTSFAELLWYNREVKKGHLQPRFAASEVRDLTSQRGPERFGGLGRVSAKGMVTDPDCAQQCSDQYYQCREYYCDYGNCSPHCDTDYNRCINSCPTTCEDPKSTSDSTSTQLVGYSYGYQDCLEHWWEYDYHHGEWYQMVYLTYKHTTTRRTEYCDGSVTHEVVSVWYSNASCWNRTWSTCMYPWSKAWNTC